MFGCFKFLGILNYIHTNMCIVYQHVYIHTHSHPHTHTHTHKFAAYFKVLCGINFRKYKQFVDIMLLTQAFLCVQTAPERTKETFI